MRTSIATLKTLVEQINIAKNAPLTPYTNDNWKMRGNVGNYHLSQAYGGVCVHLMANENGGVTTPIWHGHIAKRDAENMIRAFLRGMNA